MLELKAVSISAGREAVLTRASVGFPTGAITTVLGLSAVGRGKLARVLSGLDAIREGQILVSGAPLSRSRKKVALAGPFPGSAGGRRPRDLLSRALRDGGAKRETIRLEVERLAGELGVGSRLDDRIRDLPAEEVGRLMIVAVFAARPIVAVFDQVLDGFGATLSIDAREMLLRELGRRSTEAGTTTVWLSAVAGDAKIIGGWALVAAGGRVAAMEASADVFERPVTLAVAQAVTTPSLNRIQLAAKDGVLRLTDGSRFEAPEGLMANGEGVCTLAFRPEDIGWSRSDDASVRFVVRMTGEETIGGSSWLRIGFAGETWLAPKPETGAPGIGVTLSVFVDRARLMAFGADGARLG